MRRLRENTMLETEIGATGEVIVEGHAIGRLDGFVFAPDAADAGSDAQRPPGRRATRRWPARSTPAPRSFRAAADDAIRAVVGRHACAGSATPVAKLVAAEDALRPRLRLIADERLTGAPREQRPGARSTSGSRPTPRNCSGRCSSLPRPEDVTGMARGIAFQLIEALGVLERGKVANDLKALDQPARATLRKYGVRFGAYHIYLPALLEAGAARPRFAPVGARSRTISIRRRCAVRSSSRARAAPRSRSTRKLPRDLYRTLGYRQSPASAPSASTSLSASPISFVRRCRGAATSPGPKPAGAFDGSSASP